MLLAFISNIGFAQNDSCKTGWVHLLAGCKTKVVVNYRPTTIPTNLVKYGVDEILYLFDVSEVSDKLNYAIEHIEN